jgi:cation diffusion facilitator family transporter
VTATDRSSAADQKKSAAASSLLFGVLLTGFKLAIALLTGSLALLGDAAGAGLDLLAAGATLFAVRISSRPPDSTHHYGHGKIENLSALFEMVLLIGASLWVIYEAVRRLQTPQVEVNASIWAFVVMGVSIAVDLTRVRFLQSTAQRTNSQALAADALNYRTDLLSSAVVILGLACVRLGQAFPGLGFLAKADPVAAIGVSLVNLFLAARMEKEAVEGLLDQAPEVSKEEICREVKSVAEVIDCRQVRVRASGPDLFVDVHVSLDGEMRLREAREVMRRVEGVVRKKLPNAEVAVHPEEKDEGKKGSPSA